MADDTVTLEREGDFAFIRAIAVCAAENGPITLHRPTAKDMVAAIDRLASPAPDADPWATGATISSLSFEPGTLTIRKDGSGHFGFGEDCVDWEVNDETGKDVMVVNLPAGEAHAIRDWLNKWLPPTNRPAPDAGLVEAELPRLDDGLIEAALVGHYGKKLTGSLGIDGVDLTVSDANYSFKQGFTRMWAGVRRELKRRAALREASQ